MSTTRGVQTVSLGEGCFLFVFLDPTNTDADERIIRQIKVPALWLSYGKELAKRILRRDRILWEVINLDDQLLVHIFQEEEKEE